MFADAAALSVLRLLPAAAKKSLLDFVKPYPTSILKDVNWQSFSPSMSMTYRTTGLSKSDELNDFEK